MTIDETLAIIARYFDCEPHDLKDATLRGNPRKAAMFLLKEHCEATVDELAVLFNTTKPAVERAIEEFLKLHGTNAAWRINIGMIRGRLRA